MYIFNILVLFRYNTAMNNNRFSIYSSIIKSDIIKTVYEELIKKTNRLIQIWDEYIELIPKRYTVMLNWQKDLTKSLKHWIDLGDTISSGDLILARVNLGMLTESLLKIFFTIYHIDYEKDESKILYIKTKKYSVKELSFDKSISFFLSIVDPSNFNKKFPIPEEFFEKEDIDDIKERRKKEKLDFENFGIWLNDIRRKRNAVHSFSYNEIGSYENFIKDILKYNAFLDIIIEQLPEGFTKDYDEFIW